MSKKDKDYVEHKGIKFAKGFDIEAFIAQDDTPDPEFDAAMKAQAKIRITTMVDEDIYHELKRISGKPGAKKYQTILNDLLRSALFPTTSFEDNMIAKMKKLLPKIENMIEERDSLKTQVEQMWKIHKKGERSKTFPKKNSTR